MWSLGDLFENGQAIPFIVWQAIGLSITFFIIWRGMINAIERKWKKNDLERTCNQVQISVKYNDKVFNIMKLDSKQLQLILVEKKYVESKPKLKYCSMFNVDNSNELWSHVYLLPHSIMYDNEIKEL